MKLNSTMIKNNEATLSEAKQTIFGDTGAGSDVARASSEEVECPLCQTKPRRFATDYLGFNLCRCASCGLQFLNPRPSVEQLTENIYNETYFSDYVEEFSEAEKHAFNRQLGTLEQLRGRKGTLLDVGCGDGAFLRYAQQLKWIIAGTDIRLAAAARKLSCPLREGQLTEIQFGDERFDVIRFNQVLEHTQNPLPELVRSRELLNPDGIIFISVPNIAGLSPSLKSAQSHFRLKRHLWRHYAALHHLWFFAPETLQKIIERAGLRVLRWETPVMRKSHQNRFIEQLNRQFLERSRTASIMDFYCTHAQS